MLVLHILCHNLVGYESSRGLGTKIAECGYETSKPGYESSGYEKSMGTKRLVSVQLPYGKSLAADESTWRKRTHSLGKKLQGNFSVTQVGMAEIPSS